MRIDFFSCQFAKAQDAVTVSPPPSAPQVYSPEDVAKRSTKQLTGIVKLTEDQSTKVITLYLVQNEIVKLNEDFSLDDKKKDIEQPRLR